MKRQRFARLREVLARATELPQEERAAYLNEACGDDTALREEAEAILAREGDSPSFLGTDGEVSEATDDRSSPSDTDFCTRNSPHHIGPYRILERIGEGGFGEVFAAEQSEPVKRRVALKVLKAGLDTREVLARFEAERQALAMMDHPNVCRVLDAGETPHGRPYFVMELLHGEPLVAYCDHHRLTMTERLDLFLPVCHAIQHAHQKGVIHRDVKPSNVLVTLVDGKPVPKVIDFGIAKATAQTLTEKTLYTVRGQVVGTPAYMSPEQAELTGLDVDTRTDVYSLGVLLYELLTGRLPFEMETLKEAGLDGMRRIIREEEPPKPSTRVSALGEEARDAAARRRTDPAHWRKALRRELDWIVMKALEKDRNRRYETVSGLAADVGRYIADEPVLAGPPSTVYRLQKYVKRHRVGVGFAGLVAAGVVLAFVLVTGQNARIAAARDEAETARDEAEAVTTTLEEMLASVDPTKSGRDVTVKEMLDQTAKTLGEKFKSQPLVEARLRYTVGKTYSALGEYDTAEEHLRGAMEIRSELLGPEHAGTLEVRNYVANVYLQHDRYEDAETLSQETLETALRVLGDEHPVTLVSRRVLAYAYGKQGRFGEAEDLLRRNLEVSRRAVGEEHRQTLRTMYVLGHMYSSQYRSDDVIALLGETLGIQRRVLGEEHLETLATMKSLATSCARQGHYDEAEALQRKALEIERRVLGEEHPVALWTMWHLGWTYQHKGSYEEAERMWREILELRRRAVGDGDPLILKTMGSLVWPLWYQDRFDEALTLERKVLETNRHVFGEGHPSTNLTRYNHACNLALQGHRSEALSLLREALDNGFLGPQTYRGPDKSILDDPDLASLHGDPEFQAIVEELEQRDEESWGAEATTASGSE